MNKLGLALIGGLLTLPLQVSAQVMSNPSTIATGNSLCKSGGVVDVCAPIYTPLAGNYSVLYTGSLQARGTDDFSILECGVQNNSIITYTMPQSTSTVFPQGHQAAFKNSSTSQTAPGICIITATTSVICGAAGIVTGSPASPCGPITLFPGGEVTLIALQGGNYKAVEFKPGVWFQAANNTASLLWTFPAYNAGGYYAYDLTCNGVIPVTNNVGWVLQVAYGGVMQVSGYAWEQATVGSSGNTTPSFNASDSSISLFGGLANDGPSTINGVSTDLLITQANGTGAYNRVDVTGDLNGRAGHDYWQSLAGQGPASSSANLTGLQVFMTSGNILTGLCSLRPHL